MVKLLRKQLGEVLGHNARALYYSNQDKSAAGIGIARRKLTTKRLLQQAGRPTPRLYATISSRSELQRFRWTKLPASFVIKPNSAYGGGGILIIFGRNKKGNWVKADRTEVPIRELQHHIQDILDGNFSPANLPDTVLIEQRVKIHPDLKPYTYQGTPDIRIIVYNLVPVMAMLRLPTAESHGKANLHAGGVGVGVDLIRGTTTTAIYRGRHIDTLRHRSISGIRLPHWPATLLLASQVSQTINLPFAGVDIAIDRDDGPIVLEANARPGLDIQLANAAALRSRLRRVEGLTITSPAQGVRIGKNLFGSDLAQEIEDFSGQIVLAVTEPVQLRDTSGELHTITAKIDTGAWRTTLDQTLAQQWGLTANIIDRGRVRGALGHQERPVAEFAITVRDRTIKTQAYLADRSHMTYPIIIGRRDLKGFLVDPWQKHS